MRRSRRPKLDRRGGCDFPASGIAASLSDGGEVPALGVLGLLEETIVDWIRMCRRSDRECAVPFARRICLN